VNWDELAYTALDWGTAESAQLFLVQILLKPIS
jgi:hypothetical protein